MAAVNVFSPFFDSFRIVLRKAVTGKAKYTVREWKMLKRSVYKKILLTAVAVDLVLLTLSLTLVSKVGATSPEYIEVTCRGDSMYPAIADGDTVTVEMFIDVNAIKVGDIIVYGSIAALAWNPNPTSIWIAHRVTEKYVEDGELCFRTKGDNDPKADPWQVPAYWVTGKVISISHTGHPPQTAPDTSPAILRQMPAYGIGDAEMWFAVVGSTGLVTIVVLKTLNQRKHQSSSSQTSPEKCLGCRHHQAQYAYRIVQVNGRLEMRKTIKLSGGYCLKHGVTLFEGLPKRRCRKFEPRSTALSQE